MQCNVLQTIQKRKGSGVLTSLSLSSVYSKETEIYLWHVLEEIGAIKSNKLVIVVKNNVSRTSVA